MALKKQILIVEDNDLNREILSSILSPYYQVLEAENGQVALDLLKEHGSAVSLILLDVMMPVMDGYTFLDCLKQYPELSLIPVIVTTQSTSEEDEVAALAHGATDFVSKPYRPQVILHRVAGLIKLRENAAIVNQLQYDQLTGLYNQPFFYRHVQKLLLEHPDADYLIVSANIENYTLIRDIFGVSAGDRILKEASTIAQQILGDNRLCCRYGTHRFLFLLTRDQFEHHRESSWTAIEQTISPLMRKVVTRWGIYEITDRTIPVDQMCGRALLTADSIKNHYRQYSAVYDDALHDKLLRQQAITDVMETALADEQFIVYLQPQYSLSDSRISGAEALVRWIHPEWGFMSPGEFIPLFEQNGFISKLDHYVWEKVCAQLRTWREQGFPLLPVSVNVSRADMFQDDLVETILALTTKYDIDPSYLHLEITESAYVENPSTIIRAAEELRERGFIVEMDDFGSGYSSLNMLSQMSLDILKLDMKFIQNETAKPADRSFLRDVISMAHRVGMSVVAEGVESREQADRLLEVGCNFVQGYFFAKPMPIPEYEALLNAQITQ